MKKLTAFSLIFVLALSFAACSGGLNTAPTVTEPAVTSAGVLATGEWFDEAELAVCGLSGLAMPQGVTPGAKVFDTGSYTPLIIELNGLSREAYVSYIRTVRSFLSENCGGAYKMTATVDDSGESTVSFSRLTRIVDSELAGDEFYMYYKAEGSVFRIGICLDEQGGSTVTVQNFTVTYGDAQFDEPAAATEELTDETQEDETEE